MGILVSIYNYRLPKTVRCKIAEKQAKKIISGNKRWTVRLLRSIWRTLYTDDRIIFTYSNGKRKKELKVIVRDRIVFDTFEDLFAKLDIDDVMPGYTVDEAIAYYKGMYRDYANNKIIAIGIERI